jgi:flagellar biosynthesis protein FliQ
VPASGKYLETLVFGTPAYSCETPTALIAPVYSMELINYFYISFFQLVTLLKHRALVYVAQMVILAATLDLIPSPDVHSASWVILAPV